jgi:phospholipase/carboxylesterase
MKRLVLATLAAFGLGAGGASAQTLASLKHQGLDPASGQPPKQLVVFFHGYTQKGEAMRPLATALSKRLPDAAFVFDNGPLVQGSGFSWYDFQGPNAATTRQAAQDNAAKLVKSLSEAYKVAPQNIVTVGFSQGGGVAAMGATCSAPDVKAVVSLAGVIPQVCQKEASGAPTKILIVWNEGDPTVKRDRIDAGVATLKTAGYDADLKTYDGDAHWPAPDALKAAEDFIVAELGGR